jgi:SAM-dependent methyltransferase
MKMCRLCNGNDVRLFLSLGNSPLANSYLSKADLNKMEPYYPLDVYVCPDCWLVQLEEFENPKSIFTEYAYFSSQSISFLRQCQEYAESVIHRFGLNSNSFVMEIASNDGYLLQYFKRHQIPVLGIEPAKNVAAVAIRAGIPTDVTFFNTNYATKIAQSREKADLIVGNNVLAHNPNLNDFVEGMRIALKPKGIITIEFPHLLKLLDENQFDTIYHEHFSYFSFHAAQTLFKKHGIEIFDVEILPLHGGSLRIYGRHVSDGSKPITSDVTALLQKEKQAGLLTLAKYADYTNKVNAIKRNLLQFLIEAKNAGKRIAGCGAPAKGNTLLNYCGIRSDLLEYTVDTTPYKQGKFLPGTHLSIYPQEKIAEDKPDYVLILPWNLKDEIMRRLSYIQDWGGRFIIPIPELKIL